MRIKDFEIGDIVVNVNEKSWDYRKVGVIEEIEPFNSVTVRYANTGLVGCVDIKNLVNVSSDYLFKEEVLYKESNNVYIHELKRYVAFHTEHGHSSELVSYDLFKGESSTGRSLLDGYLVIRTDSCGHYRITGLLSKDRSINQYVKENTIREFR